MYIKYSADGSHESFSNSQRKSMDVFMEQRQFCVIISSDVQLTKFTNGREIECYFDIDSLLTMVNMDCANCMKLYPDIVCGELYPIDIVLDVDEHFSILKIIVFVSCEDTRLVSYYGKRGHLKHCVDDNLLENPYYNSDNDKCNKRKQFLSGEYRYAYLSLADKLSELVGVGAYEILCDYMDEYISSLSKVGKLF